MNVGSTASSFRPNLVEVSEAFVRIKSYSSGVKRRLVDFGVVLRELRKSIVKAVSIVVGEDLRSLFDLFSMLLQLRKEVIYSRDNLL
jgi:5-bromo-4-chloroindolyl phosphate hydrolysis protein